MYSSIKARVEALPENEQAGYRMLYSDTEWEKLWKLNAWDHQLPPEDPDWTTWTVIGPPRAGSTTAGLRWMEEKFFSMTYGRCLILLRHPQEVSRIGRLFVERLQAEGLFNRYDIHSSPDFSQFESDDGKKVLHIVKETKMGDWGGYQIPFRDYFYVWADEIEDASLVKQMLPRTLQFCFTQPTKLPNPTILSRAGA